MWITRPRVVSRSCGGVGVRMDGDLAYFRRRASEERTAALQSRHPEGQRRHAELAERYEDLVRAIAGKEVRTGIGASDDPLRKVA